MNRQQQNFARFLLQRKRIFHSVMDGRGPGALWEQAAEQGGLGDAADGQDVRRGAHVQGHFCLAWRAPATMLNFDLGSLT